MVLNLTLAQQRHTDFSPRITVVGVGGAGCNAVNNMIEMGLDGVESVESGRHDRAVDVNVHGVVADVVSDGGRGDDGRHQRDRCSE